LSGFCEHYPRTDLSPMALAFDDVTIPAAGAIGELLVPMSGFLEPVDDDEAARRVADEALGALPPDDGSFVYAVLTDTRAKAHPSDVARAARIAGQAAREERHLFLAFGSSRADRLVWANPDLILALAAELARHPILAGSPVETVIEAALTGRKGRRPVGLRKRSPKIDPAALSTCLDSYV